MSYLIFLVILLTAAVSVAVLRAFGFRIKFEVVFKVLALAVVMLPVVAMSALIMFALAVGACMVILAVLYAMGAISSFSDIPKEYVVMGLWALLALAIIIMGVQAIRYIALVRDE